MQQGMLDGASEDVEFHVAGTYNIVAVGKPAFGFQIKCLSCSRSFQVCNQGPAAVFSLLGRLRLQVVGQQLVASYVLKGVEFVLTDLLWDRLDLISTCGSDCFSCSGSSRLWALDSNASRQPHTLLAWALPPLS